MSTNDRIKTVWYVVWHQYKSAISPATEICLSCNALPFPPKWLTDASLPDRQPDREKRSEVARATFLDSSLGEEIRLDALNDFRPPTTAGYPQQYIDGGAALSGDIAIVAAQIASVSKDPDVREVHRGHVRVRGQLTLV